MNHQIAHINLLVKDYNEAINYYTNKLNFIVIGDVALSETKRWVRIKPQGNSNFALLLAKADGEKQIGSIGNQTGGRVFLFLTTDNFYRDYPKMKANGIQFKEEPREEVYGTVAVFSDIYGNLWDFIEP
ncbi:VOC family protein [uncultured Maribacter sp.]|uniref:VOC family protein n=1 Tax=uncultured Maribacter sp. TaxID=431308 RepID=UPI00260E855D|nr:VOC family protein [uncultured Maribacter sp.]